MADGYVRSPLRSEEKVRNIAVYPPGEEPAAPVAAAGGAQIQGNDAILAEVRAALADGFGGVIFEGPPGTSKSWYASEIAGVLADNDVERVRRLQFHPSYQYEDFIEGWVPQGDSFARKDKHLMLIADRAKTHPEEIHVLVIDELSRSDPARVFGEALTYVEQTKRGLPFRVASGQEVVIPPNLVIIATMNTFDRGVDEVDAAFDRRMAKIEMSPQPAVAERFMHDAGMPDELRSRVMEFYAGVLRLPEHYARIGHTYFMGLATEDDLHRRWRLQLVHVFRKAYRTNPEGFNRVEASWQRIFPPPPDALGEGDEEQPGATHAPLPPAEPTGTQGASSAAGAIDRGLGDSQVAEQQSQGDDLGSG